MVSCFGVLVSDLCYSNEDEYEDAPCAAVEPGSLTCFAGGKYCAPAGPSAALLFIKTKFWDRPFPIKDMAASDNGKALFTVAPASLGLPHPRTLVDAETHEPIFAMPSGALDFGDSQRVLAPDGATELFRVGANCTNSRQWSSGLTTGPSMHPAKPGGVDVQLAGKIKLTSMKGTIWAGEPGQGRLVAKVCGRARTELILPGASPTDDLIVEVAAGMDMALVVAMILADEDMQKRPPLIRVQFGPASSY